MNGREMMRSVVLSQNEKSVAAARRAGCSRETLPSAPLLVGCEPAGPFRKIGLYNF